MSDFATFWGGLTEAEKEAKARQMGSGDIAGLPIEGEDAAENPFFQAWTSPGPVADAFYWSDDDVCLMRGPVGSGKTTSNLRKPFRRALMMPRSSIDGVRHYKVVIARATYRQLWQTTIPSWFEVVPRKMGHWAGGRGDPVTHTIQFEDEHGPVHFEAQFLAFGETDAEIQANVRGVQTTDFLFEEADTVRPILFATAIGRIDRYPKKDHFRGYPDELRSYGQINMTYNAPEEGNWILALEGDEDADGVEDRALLKMIEDSGVAIKFYRQPGAFEPGAENMDNLGPKYYARQIAAMTAAGRRHEVERLVHNKIGYIPDGDPVFEKHYNRRIHVSSMPLEPWPGVGLRIGLDQGFFGAAVVLQFRPPFQWQILRELYFKKRMFARPFGRALRALLDDDPMLAGLPIEGAWGDMAGEQGNAAGSENENWNEQVSLAAGITIEPQMHGSNRIEPRLNVWRAAFDNNHLGEPCMSIDPVCKGLIRGFEAKYVWAEETDKAGNRTTKPKKRGVREADLIDAGGYVLLSEVDFDGLTPLDDPGARSVHGNMGHNGGPPMAQEKPWVPSMGLGG